MLSKEEIAKAYEALSRLVESQYSMAHPFHNPVHSDVELAIREIKAHIAELEENATAQALALKAAKAMQQAETERADANQAKIDALMFEHCPDEMTDEQKHKWAISQAVSKLTKPDIAALIAISNGEDLPNGK